MKLSIGCDHGGFLLKEAIKKYLSDKGHIVYDCGCYSQERVDYPVYAGLVCKSIQEKKAEMGILICTTGVGMSIAANKYKGIRAALISNIDACEFSRRHNDSNVLCLGAKYIKEKEAFAFADEFLNTEFAGGRHARRLAMIDEIIR